MPKKAAVIDVEETKADGETITPTRLTRILLLHESTGDVAINISSDEALMSVALAIVNQRLNAGFYPTPAEPTKPLLTTDKAASLKLPEDIRAFVRSSWGSYREKMNRYSLDSAYHKLAEEAVNEKNGEKAWNLLQNRSDFEGESYQILEVRNSY